MKWTLISDDLSGACETGSAINQELNSTCIPLKSYLSVDLFSAGNLREFDEISLIDLNIRDCTAHDALAVFTDFLNIMKKKNPKSVNFFKLDSLLRGNLGVQAKILAAQYPLIFIPAVPSINRTVKKGQVYIQEVALEETNLWRDQHSAPPKKIGELFPEMKVIYSDFKSPEEIENILSAISPGEIFIPDIQNSQELTTFAGILTKFPHIIALGSAEFALAHFTAFLGNQVFHGEDVMLREIVGATVVVGSNSTLSLSQLAHLQSSKHTPLSPDDKVIKVSQGDDLAYLHQGDFAAQALFISGGTTARRFLDSAGISRLRMLNSLEYGVSLGVSAEKQLIGIKPGSFGKEDTISKSLAAMRALSTLPNRI